MRTKDEVLLEEVYSKILLKEEDKYQPNDPEMEELSKVGMGEEFPEDNSTDENDIYTQQTKDEPLTQDQMVEAQTLADYIEKNINVINPEMNYKTLANAIKIILKDFGSHNMPAFIEEIQK